MFVCVHVCELVFVHVLCVCVLMCEYVCACVCMYVTAICYTVKCKILAEQNLGEQNFCKEDWQVHSSLNVYNRNFSKSVHQSLYTASLVSQLFYSFGQG